MTDRSSGWSWAVVVVAVVLGYGLRTVVGGTAGLVAGVALFVLVSVVWQLAVVVLEGIPAAERRGLEAVLDPAGGPPADAVVGRSTVADRYVGPAGLRLDVLADDFRARDEATGEAVPRETYLRNRRRVRFAFRRSTAVLDEVRIRPADPARVWILVTSTATPWVGRSVDATWWGELTTTEDGERITSVRTIAVLRIA